MNVDKGKTSAINFDAEFKRLSRRKRKKVSRYQDSYELTDEEYSYAYSEVESGFESDDGVYEMPDSDDLIDFLIDNSKLDPIITIRRYEHQTALLKRELKDLVEEKTLDPGQLKSFIESLVEPVHLTQGPPGTGKSYLGVVIVQALIKIRNAWMSVSQSVGEPPILVLSYKNHAIDEFLVDLVNSERNVSLIRIGGSCNDPNLSMYLEQNQSTYKDKTEKSRTLLRKLHNQKTDHQEMKNRLSPLSGWDALRGFADKEDKEMVDAVKKAAFQATVYLCSLIMKIREIEAYLVRDENDCDSSSSDDAEKEGFTDFWERLFSEKDQDIIKTMIQTDIEALWNYVTHYKLTVPEIFYRWLSGFRPLAKCVLAECSQVVRSREHKYCEDHLCAYGSDKTIPRCMYPRIPDHYLCNQHACQAEECRAVKLPSPQLYCDEHACFVCVREGCVAKLGEDEPPRNTCNDHKLCTALIGEGFTCTELSTNNTQFCEEHAKPACSYVFPDGHHCPKYAASRGITYCDDHKPKLKSVTEFKDFSARKCKALTKKNKDCKSKPMDGFEYCRVHVEKYKASPVNSQTENENAWDMIPDEISTSESVKKVSDLHQPKPLSSKEKLQEENNFFKEQDDTLVLEKTEEINEIDSENADECEIAEHEEPLPDEDDVKPDDEEDYYFEEDDQLQHCRDVHVIEDREVEEKSDEEDNHITAPDELSDPATLSDVEVPVSQWNWEMNVEERWAQARLQEQKYKSLLARLNDKRNDKIEIAREEYHNAKVRAKSEVYEQKTVIGGTIVGCIGRLESIRKTKPFAILVEEASEVLEPLLFACLGEETTKFEMIGDHLQLKPSIMSKIMFERVNR